MTKGVGGEEGQQEYWDQIDEMLRGLEAKDKKVNGIPGLQCPPACAHAAPDHVCYLLHA